MAALVRQITKEGPQINRIARELGVHKETVRYWYKKLLKKGYTVHAVPDFERLGLQRVTALAEFSDEFVPFADAILMAMSELCYLTSFAKTLPEDLYSIHASVPREYSENWIRFMYALRGKGLFKSIRIYPFDWAGVVPMRSEMYDFENDSWQHDWASRSAVDPGSQTFAPSAEADFDLLDLNLIKQLQMDPETTLVNVGDKLGVNYKTLTWHYRNHVVGKGLVKGYAVNWAGTKYDPRLEKAMHKRHKYMWLELLVSDISEAERMELMAKVNQLPFVWFEAGGANYFAQIVFPMETMTEALSFVKEVMRPVRQKSTWHFLDQADALRFAIVPELYDQAAKKWVFDEAELLKKFERLVVEIKGTTS